MVLSDGTTSSLSDFFEENNPDKRVGYINMQQHNSFPLTCMVNNYMYGK